MAQQDLTAQQLASIADSARVWEVRRFCQVLPSVVQYERENGTTEREQSASEPNGALAALLRCVLYHLGADLAMVSLLDDHTQYFVSGASRTNMHDAKATLESTRWYGCESVLHHGGLCERTIAQQNSPGTLAFYEELDMANTARTKNLPFVRGDIAKFRHYAGVPLNPYGGPNIGTVFMFSEKPSQAGRSKDIRSYLTDTASHITRHLEQAVEALEGRRALRFNRGITSLLGMSYNVETDTGTESSSQVGQHDRQPLLSNQYSDDALRLYRLASKLLCDIFQLDGARVQEAGSSGDGTISNPDWNGSGVMAQYIQTDAQQLEDLPASLLSRLLRLFPQGAVFQVATEPGEIIAATDRTSAALVDESSSRELTRAFSGAEQIVLMSLWDTHHERNIGVVLGFAHDRSRAYLGPRDLSSISAFCATVMTQVRRLDVQATLQIKSDFLGSISHEMRTPLHGILSNLELLAETSLEEDRRELLEMARYSGASLLDSIDRLLKFSKISSRVQRIESLPSQGVSSLLSRESSPVRRPGVISPTKEDHPSIVRTCEQLVERAVQRLRLKRRVRPELVSPRRSDRIQNPSASSPLIPPYRAPRHLSVVFDTNAARSCRLLAVADFKTVFTNLLDNALKFGDPTGCIRVHLMMNDSSVRLSFHDTGKGIAPDYIRHRVFEPFSQENPQNEGTGLGLSLVQQTVTALGGDVLIDSHETRGSTFTATFPVHHLIYRPHQEEAVIEGSNWNSSAFNLPPIELSLFTSGRWVTGDDIRDQRCTDMILTSLKEGTSQWFQTTIVPWDTKSTLPRVLFAFVEDVDLVVPAAGDALDHSKLVVLCPHKEDVVCPRVANLENATAHFGPVTPTSLQEPLARLYPDVVSPSKTKDPLSSPSMNADDQHLTHAEGPRNNSTTSRASDPFPGLADLKLETPYEHEVNRSSVGTLERSDQLPTGLDSPVQTSNTNSPARVTATVSGTSTERSESTRPEPKLLLVDDNSINLKVISMFARKASSTPSASVNSGREALEVFNEALRNNPYDLIFLDLSMPEISGFEVAERIRKIEASTSDIRRTYICALTALVSADDRHRAYAAGVDEYVVKPAKFEDLKDVIDRWRKVD